jgi:hypothetical protein
MLTLRRNICIYKSSPVVDEISHFLRNWRVKKSIPTLPPAFLLLRFLPSLCPLVPGAPPSPPLSSLERISPSSRRLRPPPPPLPFLLAGVSSITCKKIFLNYFVKFFLHTGIFLLFLELNSNKRAIVAAGHATT